MARLAVVEQSLRDVDKFHKILYELLRHINYILENPHDYDLRIIKSDILRDYLKCEAFNEYMKYVGFQQVSTENNIITSRYCSHLPTLNSEGDQNKIYMDMKNNHNLALKNILSFLKDNISMNIL